MKAFSQLILQLEDCTDSHGREKILTAYISRTDHPALLWTVAILSGKQPKRLFTLDQLKCLAQEQTGIPDWLFDESYQLVGDLAEAIACIWPNPDSEGKESLDVWMKKLHFWRQLSDDQHPNDLFAAWDQLEAEGRLILNKLLTGTFKTPVKTVELIRALHLVTGISKDVLAMKIDSDWEPGMISLEELLESSSPNFEVGRPLPFHPIRDFSADLDSLCDPGDWFVEDVLDGIRVQLVHQDGVTRLWTDEYQLITQLFPEIVVQARTFQEDIILEGILVGVKQDHPSPRSVFQSRLDRRKVTAKVLQDLPARMIVTDCLKKGQVQLGQACYAKRRQTVLEVLSKLDSSVFWKGDGIASPADWQIVDQWRTTMRERYAVGIVLKHRFGIRGQDQADDTWWMLRGDLLQLEMVMLYVEARRNQSYESVRELTLGLMHGESFIPVTKTSEGLTNEDVERIDTFVRENTVERFGPVRQVLPKMVFSVQFERVCTSQRHRSGLSLVAPRIRCWKNGMDVHELVSLSELKKWVL